MAYFLDNDEFTKLLNEACACGEGEGSEVLMQNLAKIHEYSGEVLACLSQENVEIEDWVEDKISKASQSLSDVKHYLEYKKSAYASQMHAISQHAGNMHMGQQTDPYAPVPANSMGGGDKLSVMDKQPDMTPASSMLGRMQEPEPEEGEPYYHDEEAEYEEEYGEEEEVPDLMGALLPDEDEQVAPLGQ